MIVGSVRSGVASVPLTIRGPDGHSIYIDAAIDTGFNGQLSLTEECARDLGLVARMATTCEMADGTKVRVELFDTEVEWSDGWRPVVAACLAGGPLVGMGMLEGSRLSMDVVQDGRVDIRSIE